MLKDDINSEVTSFVGDKIKADNLLYTILLADDIVMRFDIIRNMDTNCAKECLYTIIDHLHRSDTELIVIQDKDML